MEFKAYFLSEFILEDTGKTIILPVPPTKTYFIVDIRGSYTIRDVINDIQTDSDDMSAFCRWMNYIFSMYVPHITKFSKVDINKPDIQFYYPSSDSSPATISTAEYIDKYDDLVKFYDGREYVVPFSIEAERLFVRLAFASTRNVKDKGRSLLYPFTSMCLDRQDDPYAFTNVFYIMEIYRDINSLRRNTNAVCIKIGTTSQDLSERYKYNKGEDVYYFEVSKTMKLPMKLLRKERYTSKGNLEKMVLNMTGEFMYNFPEEYCNRSKELRKVEAYAFIKDQLDSIIRNDYCNFTSLVYLNEQFRGQLCDLIMLNRAGDLSALSESLATILSRVLGKIHSSDREIDSSPEPRYISFFKRELMIAKREILSVKSKPLLDGAFDMYSKLLASLRQHIPRGTSKEEQPRLSFVQNNNSNSNNHTDTKGFVGIHDSTFHAAVNQAAALTHNTNTINYTAGNGDRNDQILIYEITVAHSIYKFFKVLHTEKYFLPLDENRPALDCFIRKVIVDFNKPLYSKIPAIVDLVMWFNEN
jgi:hypothetical protein